MRKKLIYFIASGVIIGITCSGTAVLAKQVPKPLRTPFPDAYQEYIYDVNDFYKDQQSYASAISQYKAYQTAQSKEDAIDASKTMLESGRIALKQYVYLLSNSLSKQEDFNPRVKQAILQDLTVHNTYLDSTAQSIANAKTTSELVDLSKGMDLRITYIKATGAQALGYIDAVTQKRRIDEARIIVNEYNSIIIGYPPANRSRGIIEKWVQESIPDLAASENQLAQFVDALYPLPSTGNNHPFYEDYRTINNLSVLQGVVTKQKNYAIKFKDINQIARTAYQEL